jgi:hypothetical protein
MTTCTLPHRRATYVRHVVAIGLTTILILISLVLITSAILAIVLSTTKDQDPIQADPIQVVQNSITPAPVPTPSATKSLPNPSDTPAPVTIGASEPSALPVPIPTPL